PLGVREFTRLETFDFKFNANPSAKNSAVLFATDRDKSKLGRNAGPTHPTESTWKQETHNAFPMACKLEDSHLFGPKVYLTGMYAHLRAGESLSPRGGSGATTYLDAGAVWRNSYSELSLQKQERQWRADAD